MNMKQAFTKHSSSTSIYLHFFALGHAVLPDLYIPVCYRNAQAPRTNHLPQSKNVVSCRADSPRSSRQSKVNQFAFKTYHIHMQYPTTRMRAIYKSTSVNSFLKIFWYSPAERNLVIEFYIIFLQKMCTFDEQKLNNIESKGHVHI